MSVDTLDRPTHTDTTRSDAANDGQDSMIVAGMALISIGAGMLMAHSGIRKQAKELLLGVAPELDNLLNADSVGGLFEDVERYMKIRSM